MRGQGYDQINPKKERLGFHVVNVTVNADSPVPVRDQLVEQIGLQIASGILPGNEKLPSIRALAQKLGIHHGIVNAAYNRLAESGMLEIRHGSGVRVVPRIGLGQNQEQADVYSLFVQFVEQANRLGYSKDDIARCYERFIKREKITKIVVVDRNPDFHAVILAELQNNFSVPVMACTAEQLHKDHSILKDSLVITSLYHFLSVHKLPIDPTRFLICNIQPPETLLKMIKELPDASIILLISVSPTLLKIGSNIAAALRGESIVVRTIDADDETEIAYMMKHAQAVICDLPSKEKVTRLAGKNRIHVFNLYSDKTIELIKDHITKDKH